MKILVIPSWFATKSYPNLGSFFWEEAVSLRNEGNDLTFLNLSLAGRKDYLNYLLPKISILKREEISVIEFVTPSFNLFKYIRVLNFIALFKLIYLIKTKKLTIDYDIVHAHSSFFAGYIANYLNRKFGLPYILTEQSSDFFIKKNDKYRSRLTKKIVDDSKYTICVSNELKRIISNYTDFQSKITVLPYMSNSIFKYKEKLKRDYFTFLFIGRLDDNKRVNLVIDAFYKMYCMDKKIKLNIVGSGQNEARIKKQISEYNLEKSIILLGQLSREEVKEQLWKSDVFILASYHETFGLVYIEALSSGTPVIGVYNGGANDIINTSNGYIVQRDDIEALCTAMINIKKNYSDFDLKKISKDTIERFGEKTHLNRLIEILKS